LKQAKSAFFAEGHKNPVDSINIAGIINDIRQETSLILSSEHTSFAPSVFEQGDSARGTFPRHKKLGSDDGSLFEHYHSKISALDAKPSVLATPQFSQFLILRRTPPNQKRIRNARSFIAMKIDN